MIAFRQAAQHVPCPQAMELLVMFAITTPNVYPRPTVEACKVHIRFCRACAAFLDSFGTLPPLVVLTAQGIKVLCPIHGLHPTA
jgi:hypothetical protein